jgi:hypothetical protein
VLLSVLDFFFNFHHIRHDETSLSTTNSPRTGTVQWLGIYSHGQDHQWHRMTLLESNATVATTFTVKRPLKDDELDPTLPTFAACLLVKDDNHWLIEWLAYHYHVLPLRHLVLVKDPSSTTTPQNILHRWRYSNMVVEQWTDNDFLPPWILKKAADVETTQNSTRLWLHLNRQKVFYAKCLQHLYSHNHRAWVLLTDSDEFVRINPYRHQLSMEQRKRPGYVARFLQSMDPDQLVNRSCYLVPRIQVSSIEASSSFSSSSSSSILLNDHESSHGILSQQSTFNTSDFLTLRFLYHNGREMKSGKNIINLAQVHAIKDLPSRSTQSVHRAYEACPENTGHALHAPDSHFQIQHYLGTYEQFTYRDDPRDVVQERRTSWYTRGRSPEPNERDTGITVWLDGFVETHGLDQTLMLLEGVGKLEPRPSPDVHVNPESTSVPPPLSLQSNYFSCCMVLKDDNHWLIEWLAYHYHVLPLRQLIVMVDPTSRSSPDFIFQRWKGRIHIEKWSEDSVIPSHIFKKVQNGNITLSGLHRHRQQFFYGYCLRHLRERNASWTLLVDTDEFVVPNPMSDLSNRVPYSLREPGVVRKLLQMGIKNRRIQDAGFTPSCLLIPRIQMTNQLPDDSTLITQQIPNGFSGEDFLTTKWLFHNEREIYTGHNLDGKNLINLDHVKLNEIPTKIRNVHYVLPDNCPVSDGERLSHPDTWLWIYHYLGSLEQYTFRRDPRDDIQGRPKRNETLWKSAGQEHGKGMIHNDTVMLREWIAGFVESVGQVEAERLLHGVGQTTIA